MPRNIPSLKPRELVRLLEAAGCSFHREGKGDHRLYVRYGEGKKGLCPLTWVLARSHLFMLCGFFVSSGCQIKKLRTCLVLDNAI